MGLIYGYNERFNGKLRDELLNGEIFYTLKVAQTLIEQWRRHYNTVRPHSSLATGTTDHRNQTSITSICHANAPGITITIYPNPNFKVGLVSGLVTLSN